MKKIKIGLDIDGTINSSEKSIKFFSILTNGLKKEAEIYIITYRDKDKFYDETIEELKEMNIHYDHLKFVDSHKGKSTFIIENGIDVFMDDTDETFQYLPWEDCFVLKSRDEMNYDFPENFYDKGKWIYDDNTGRNIDNFKGF